MCLSRITQSAEGQLFSLSLPNFSFLDQLRQSLHSSVAYLTLLQNICQFLEQHDDFSMDRKLIFFHRKIWLLSDKKFIPIILEEFHSTPLRGHMGYAKTLHRIQAKFHWSNMRSDVRHFISRCTICQQTKYKTKKPVGLLQPLPIPNAPWEELSLDFIGGLPQSHGYCTILVIVDRYSKGAHFGTLLSRYTAHSVALLFFDLVCKLHGFLRSLVSNRDSMFISTFWWELFHMSGTKLRMSTTYQPKIDGQTKVLNRILEQYLLSFVHDRPQQWFWFLALAEWSYNTFVHSSIGLTQFKVTYGKPPPSIPQYLQGTPTVEVVDAHMTAHSTIHSTLQCRLRKAQTAMKNSTDTHRCDIPYSIGGWVYLRLRPYRQSSIATTYNKLSKRYFGPFQITECMGPVAYRLQLLESSKIHPVFLVSLLKLHHNNPPDSRGSLPPTTHNNAPVVQPLTMLDWKWNRDNCPPTKLVLVQWMRLSQKNPLGRTRKNCVLHMPLRTRRFFRKGVLIVIKLGPRGQATDQLTFLSLIHI